MCVDTKSRTVAYRIVDMGVCRQRTNKQSISFVKDVAISQAHNE